MKKKRNKKQREFIVKLRDKSSGFEKRINVKQFRLENGMIENFFTDQDKSSVQIFPITSDHKVYTVKQWRPGLEKEQIELPGGGLSDGEDLEGAARRELKEETGLDAEEMLHISSLNYSPYSSGIRHMFLATGCKKVARLDLDPNEFLEVVVWDLNDFKEKLLKTGQVRGFDLAYLALDRLNLLD